MLNQVVMVGRITGQPNLEKKEDGSKYTNIKIAVPRSYKNEEGIYDTDFIDCVLCSSLAENAVEYCKQGDLVGIKGRLQNNDNILNVVAEKLTFLSSSRKSDE